MLLYWTERANEIKKNLQAQVVTRFGEQHNKYIAILYFWDNSSSATYVKFKKRYGEDIGIGCKIFRDEDVLSVQNRLHRHSEPACRQTGESEESSSCMDSSAKPQNDAIWEWQHPLVKNIFSLITQLNTDEDCIWIMIQLPLPKALQAHKEALLASINPLKDIDGLGGIMSGLSAIDLIDFLPATPKAVIEVLATYDLNDLKWKKIVIIGQSNLIGKPLAIECMKRWGTVSCFNSLSDQEYLKNICKQSDIIISCTGVIHLVNAEFVREDQSQIVIDVGYGHDKSGKAVGDVDIESIKDKVFAYTPLPWGIWPLTIASLFSNIFVLQDLKEQLKDILPQHR